MQLELVTEGLQFPEGPIAMADGSVVLVEIRRGTLTRVRPNGAQEIIATLGGGPNGAAVGPDGAVRQGLDLEIERAVDDRAHRLGTAAGARVVEHLEGGGDLRAVRHGSQATPARRHRPSRPGRVPCRSAPDP